MIDEQNPNRELDRYHRGLAFLCSKIAHLQLNSRNTDGSKGPVPVLCPAVNEGGKPINHTIP